MYKDTFSLYRSCRRCLLLWLVLSSQLERASAFLTPLATTRNHHQNRDIHQSNIPLHPKRGVSYASNIGQDENDGAWEVGNVYEDLDQLERAINFANAEQNLKQAERMEMLQHFARARHPLFPDVTKFVVAPLGLALVLRLFHQYSITRLLAKLITKVSDGHFWTFVVTAPMLLLVAKRIARPPPEPMPDELEGLDPEYLPFITTDWENPETSCRDYVLCLLEFWTSAIVGMAITGALQLFVRFPNNPFTRAWFHSAQLLTRVAALVSLHQYPRQLFQLQRSQQPRPVGLFPTLMQYLVRSMTVVAPVAIASDLSKVLCYMPRESLIAFFSSISAILIGTSIRLQHTDSLSFQRLKGRSFGGKLLYFAAATAFWRKPLANLFHDLQRLPFRRITNRLGKAPTRTVLACSSIFCIGVMPILIPIVHMCAISRVFRVVYTHDLSLSMDSESFKSCMEDESDLSKRMMWRYRLEWRDNDKRPWQLFKEWNKGWGYWWLAKGSVTEKLALAVREWRKREAMQGLTVLDRIQKDLAGTPGGTPSPDRDQWKTDAMKRIAEKHQADYDKKDFEDPLGVAVQQTFGIGLGYNFDHMRQLEDGEEPSIRRLQARAAKSAIQRVQQLYDAEAARKELEGISDPKEREKKALELRKRTDDEIQCLTKKLAELVPIGLSEEFESKTRVQQYRQSKYKKKSSHEYVLLDPLDPLESQHATDSFFEDYSASTRQFQEATAQEAQDNAPNEEEDEFIKAYTRQKGRIGDDGSEEDGDDGGIVLA